MSKSKSKNKSKCSSYRTRRIKYKCRELLLDASSVAETGKNTVRIHGPELQNLICTLDDATGRSVSRTAFSKRTLEESLSSETIKLAFSALFPDEQMDMDNKDQQCASGYFIFLMQRLCRLPGDKQLSVLMDPEYIRRWRQEWTEGNDFVIDSDMQERLDMAEFLFLSFWVHPCCTSFILTYRQQAFGLGVDRSEIDENSQLMSKAFLFLTEYPDFWKSEALMPVQNSYKGGVFDVEEMHEELEDMLEEWDESEDPEGALLTDWFLEKNGAHFVLDDYIRLPEECTQVMAKTMASLLAPAVSRKYCLQFPNLVDRASLLLYEATADTMHDLAVDGSEWKLFSSQDIISRNVERALRCDDDICAALTAMKEEDASSLLCTACFLARALMLSNYTETARCIQEMGVIAGKAMVSERKFSPVFWRSKASHMSSCIDNQLKKRCSYKSLIHAAAPSFVLNESIVDEIRYEIARYLDIDSDESKKLIPPLSCLL